MGYFLEDIGLQSKDGLPAFFYKKNGETDCFLALTPENKMIEIETAIITDKPSELTREYILSELAKSKIPLDLVFSFENSYRRVTCLCGGNGYTNGLYHRYSNIGHTPVHSYVQKYYYTNNDRIAIEISQQECKDICYKFDWFNGFYGLQAWNKSKIGGVNIPYGQLLKVIGIGKEISIKSLNNACSIEDKSPRIWVGDLVSWVSKKEKQYGTIVSFADNAVSVLLKDGKKKQVSYSKVSKEENQKDFSWRETLPKSIQENIQVSIDNTILYKAKIVKRKIEDVYGNNNIRDCNTVVCPVCEMLLAETWNGRYSCNYCNQQATCIKQESDIGIFILADKPAKNKFCIEEARCCNNCDLFSFGHSRQGKRSTGYCTFSNQCVLAHNVCKKWLPVDNVTYSKSITQHITNLGTGVKSEGSHSGLNEQRRAKELEDTVYKREDHDKQKEFSLKLKGAYTSAYSDFLQELLKKAENLPIIENI